jgi:cytochrome c-type biogenesis protein CcmH
LGELGNDVTLSAPVRLSIAVATGIAGVVAMGLGLLARFDGDRVPAADEAESKQALAGGARAELVRHLDRSPGDARSWVLLARADFEADRFADAANDYERALATGPKVALDPGIWCEYADALGMTQGGSLAGKPRELVMRALAQNPTHPKALEMAGSAAYEIGEYASAARYWRELLAQLPQASREHAELAAAIARADERAQGR